MDENSQVPTQPSNPTEPVHDHLKTIAPLHVIEQPQATPPAVRPATNQIYPTAPVDPTLQVTNKATPRFTALGTTAGMPADSGEDWKPPKSRLKTILELIFVVGLSAAAGALFHQWYKLVFKVVPSTLSVCGNATTDGLTFACHGTLASDLFASAALFSLTAFITYNIFKKSHLLAYCYGGLFVALLFFFRTALVLEFAAVYKLRWLFTENSLIDSWLIPAAVAAVPTAIVYGVQMFGGKLGKKILLAVFGVLLVASVIFMPGIVKSFVGQQSQAGTQEAESSVTGAIKNSGIPIYVPKNYDGPFELAYTQAFITNPELVPHYSFSYDFKMPGSVHSNIAPVSLYKAADDNFNPPKDCGSGRPSSFKYKPTKASPCKVVYVTDKGRPVYKFTSKTAPDGMFLVPFDTNVLSIAAPYGQKISPETIKEFVDSLEPLSGTELDEFINKEILLKQ